MREGVAEGDASVLSKYTRPKQSILVGLGQGSWFRPNSVLPNATTIASSPNTRSTDRRNYSVNRYCPTVVSFK
jgi:hypothetical protein